MAGIYIHIPFCKSRCIYCGFYSTTLLEMRDEYVSAVCRELERRKDYMAAEVVDTVYFGGGTPSQLSITQVEQILQRIYNIYNVRANAEITFEANPDDLSLGYLKGLGHLGINRLSMGIQSFDDSRLAFIRRRHTSAQAVQAVYDAIKLGFDNINIDLMYGFPNQMLDEWKDDVSKALKLPIQHISAYSLMYDEGTELTRMLEHDEISDIDEETSVLMYKYLVETLADAGFEHYEISNFCRPGYRSKHNSSYWHGVPYLGIGAGAHSYNTYSRHYNVDSLDQYISGAQLFEEKLNKVDKYNEFVFTALRTQEGLCLNEMKKKFGEQLYEYCMSNAKRHIANGTLAISSDEDAEARMYLKDEGMYISNDIMSDLFYVD